MAGLKQGRLRVQKGQKVSEREDGDEDGDIGLSGWQGPGEGAQGGGQGLGHGGVGQIDGDAAQALSRCVVGGKVQIGQGAVGRGVGALHEHCNVCLGGPPRQVAERHRRHCGGRAGAGGARGGGRGEVRGGREGSGRKDESAKGTRKAAREKM